MGIVERLLAGSVGNAGQLGVFDVQARESWPWVWELMTLTELAEGRIRIPSTVKIQLGRAEWMVSVNDEDTRQTLLVACPGLAGVWDRLEDQLHSPDAVWRQWPPKGNPRRKS